MKIPPRAVSGVYFLVDKGVVIYVGQSNHIAARLATHVRDGTKRFTTAYFVVVAPAQRLEVEALFIRGLRPKANGGRRSLRSADPKSLRKALRIVTRSDDEPDDQIHEDAPSNPQETMPELLRVALEDIAAHDRSPTKRFGAEVQLGRRSMRDLPDDFKFWVPSSQGGDADSEC